MTSRLLACSELLGVKMLDHIIVAGEVGATYSFKSEGLLERLRPESASWMMENATSYETAKEYISDDYDEMEF